MNQEQRIEHCKAFLEMLHNPTEEDLYMAPDDIRIAGNTLPDLELPKTKIDLRSESYK